MKSCIVSKICAYFTKTACQNESLFMKCNLHLLAFKIWVEWSSFAYQKILFDYHGLGVVKYLMSSGLTMLMVIRLPANTFSSGNSLLMSFACQLNCLAIK